MAGLAGLRDALKEQKDVILVVVGETPGATKDTSSAAVATYKLEGLPVLIDENKATGTALTAETDSSISYVVIKPDGSKKVLGSPSAVKKALKN